MINGIENQEPDVVMFDYIVWFIVIVLIFLLWSTHYYYENLPPLKPLQATV